MKTVLFERLDLFSSLYFLNRISFLGDSSNGMSLEE